MSLKWTKPRRRDATIGPKRGNGGGGGGGRGGGGGGKGGGGNPQPGIQAVTMAYWPMTETGTDTRADASGNGRDFGTVGSLVTSRSGIISAFATSLDLPGDATNGFISQADAAWQTLNHDFHIWGWVQFDAVNGTHLLYHYDGIRGYMAGAIDNNTKLNWFYFRGTGFQLTSLQCDTPQLVVDTPYFMEFWHQNGVQIGVRVNRGTAYTAAAVNGTGDAAETLRFGYGGGSPFNGAANGWGIASRLLTATELDWLYKNGDGRSLY